MLIRAIQKSLLLMFTLFTGLAAGGFVVTPVIALMNFRAQDGPIFPAPLVAFTVVAPISILLFILQGMVLFYEWVSKRDQVNALLWFGMAGGLAAGLVPYLLAITPYQSEFQPWPLLAFSGLGVFMGLIVFGCHWAANRVKAYFTERKVPPAFEAS